MGYHPRHNDAPLYRYRAGASIQNALWNIGAEGQVLVGGIASAACMIYLPDKVSPIAVLPIMMISSIIAGGIWGFFPGYFKAKYGTNETLFTLMMNYIAIQLTSYFVALWEKPYGSNSVGIINSRSRFGWFPPIFGQMYALNVIIVVVLVIGMYLYLKYSKQGFEIAVVGDSENTARYSAINVKRVIVRTMIISGAICGIAGFLLLRAPDIPSQSVLPADADSRPLLLPGWQNSILLSWW